VHQLEHYEIVQENEKDLYSHKSSSFANLAKRREVKVNQYKKTKKIKDHIQVSPGSVVVVLIGHPISLSGPAKTV